MNLSIPQGQLDAVLFTAPIFLHFMNHFYNILGTGG